MKRIPAPENGQREGPRRRSIRRVCRPASWPLWPLWSGWGGGAEEWGEKWGQKEARPCQNVQVSGSEPVLDQARGGGRAEVAKWMDSGWVLN